MTATCPRSAGGGVRPGCVAGVAEVTPTAARVAAVAVVVVYEHPLLGEGLARIIAAGAGVRALAVAGTDRRALDAALAVAPAVAVVERGGLLDGLDLGPAVRPEAVIEVALQNAAGSGSTSPPVGIAEVLQAVQRALALGIG